MNATILLIAWTISSSTIPQFYQKYGGIHPTGRTVHICGGSGCAWTAKFQFTHGDITVFKGLLSASQTPREERGAIARAIAWAEMRTCTKVGLCDDTGGGGGGTDCTDTTANTTSYLLLMQPYLRFHTVTPPLHRLKLFAWPHWSARLTENGSSRRWMVDSFFRANGKLPIIMREEKWLQ